MRRLIITGKIRFQTYVFRIFSLSILRFVIKYYSINNKNNTNCNE